RVAGRALADELRERGQGRIAAEEIPEQSRRGFTPERHEAEVDRGGRAAPRGMVFGTRRREEQRPGGSDPLDERDEQRLAARVDPVEILEQDDRRLAAAPHLDQSPHEREELALACLGVHARHPPPGVRYAEKIEEEWQRGGELGVEQQDGPGDLPAGGVIAV